MTDRDLADRTVRVNMIEVELRALVETDEREIATAVLRQTVALRKALEQWIVVRATKGAVGR